MFDSPKEKLDEMTNTI